MARRFVLDCDRCGGPDAESCGPFDLGDGPKAPDLCPSCQEALNVGRLIELADEYGVAEQSEPAGYRVAAVAARLTRTSEPLACPRCDAVFAAGRMATVLHMQRIHGLSMADASHLLPVEGEGVECSKGCGYYGPKQGMSAHVRWHEAQDSQDAESVA